MTNVELLGPDPPRWFADDSDGCTCSPDVWRGVVLTPACVRHDWCYTRYVDIPRYKADAYFFCNLRTLGLSRTMAFWYFLMVRIFGSAAARWIGTGKQWERYEQ